MLTSGLLPQHAAASPLAAVAIDEAVAPLVASVAAPVAPAPAPAVEAMPATTPKAAPERASVGGVHHVWQTLNNCGPAAVVMALSTLGVGASQEDARIALRGASALRGMGPQGVDPWVKQEFGLRAAYRNNGTNDLLRRLIANGFAPLVTQWLQDTWISRIAHWRAVTGYDDAKQTFYVNDSMLGRDVPLSYQWFQDNWQAFSYRWLVIYRAADERLLQAIVGRDWDERYGRQALFVRALGEAQAQQTSAAWLAFGEASYLTGSFSLAIAAFDRGLALGSAQGVYTLRSSYPQALRAVGKTAEANAAQQQLASLTPLPGTVAADLDPYALWLAQLRKVFAEPDRITD